MMFLLTCDKSQFSPNTRVNLKKITEELKHNAEWYEVREGSSLEVHWAVRWVGDNLYGGKDL